MADHYIVSARKYRPDSFASIVGQGAMSTTLRSAVLSRKMAHAYLFCGPRGVGKTTAARVLAKTINCTRLSLEAEACNECESCRAFNEQRSFNIFELDAASNNSVEDIRTLTEQVAMPPALGRYKVYIIDEVHMLSAAAFNAFLKTLEEPPSYAIFILATTEKHKILPTILSRCQIYDFKRITVGDIARHLSYVAQSEGIEAEPSALDLIAEKADGGMRDALSMFDRVSSFSEGHITHAKALDCLNILDHSYFIRILECLLSRDHRSLLLILDEILGRGFDGQLVIGGLASFCRDLLVAQHPDTLKLLEKPSSVLLQYQSLAQRCSPAMLFAGIKALVQCDQQYRAATNKRLLTELTLLTLISTFAPNAAEQQPKAAASVSTPQASRSVSPMPQPKAGNPTHNVQGVPRREPEGEASSTPSTASEEVEQQTAEKEEILETPPRVAMPITAQEEDARRGRERFRGIRRRPTATAQALGANAPADNPSEAETDEREPIVEEALQRAWIYFAEHELPQEEIFVRKTMLGELPTLIEPDVAVVRLTPSTAIIDPIVELQPRLIHSLRKQLHNGALELRIEPKEQQSMQVVLSEEARLEQMEQENPALGQLRERLNLRLIR